MFILGRAQTTRNFGSQEQLELMDIVGMIMIKPKTNIREFTLS